jgi:hypothetical protein
MASTTARPVGFVRLRLHLPALRLSCSATYRLRSASGSWSERRTLRSSQAGKQLSWSVSRCSLSLVKQPPAGPTGGFLAAPMAQAAMSVRMHEVAALHVSVQYSTEPRPTDFGHAWWPLSQPGHCGAPLARAPWCPAAVADWPCDLVARFSSRLTAESQ